MSACGERSFRDPKGIEVLSGPDPRFRGDASALERGNSYHALEIDAQTLPPRWLGERMDLAMAIGGLKKRERPNDD